MKYKKIFLSFDGASRGNPGPAAIGGILRDDKDSELERYSEYIGIKTNNYTEYRALIEGLNRVLKYSPDELHITSDSELLIKQLKGTYAVKSSNLKPLFQEAKELLSRFKKTYFTHVQRKENKETDMLCNRALDLALKERKMLSGKISVTIREKFDAAHFLRDYEGKCAGLHGHTYFVEITVSGTQLRQNGILIDFGEMKSIINSTIEEIDHKYLNEIPPFTEQSPTGENLAIYLAEGIKDKLPSDVRLTRIVIYESPDSWITYEC